MTTTMRRTSTTPPAGVSLPAVRPSRARSKHCSLLPSCIQQKIFRQPLPATYLCTHDATKPKTTKFPLEQGSYTTRTAIPVGLPSSVFCLTTPSTRKKSVGRPRTPPPKLDCHGLRLLKRSSSRIYGLVYLLLAPIDQVSNVLTRLSDPCID